MTATALDFNDWRLAYGTMSFADQQRYYNHVWTLYPRQCHWTYEHAERALAQLMPPALRVVELGGWNGALAATALPEMPQIASWTNLEICEPVVGEHSVCFDDRYHPVLLHAHVWEDPSQVPEHDLALATHTFEHLILADAIAAIEAMNPEKALYVEMPIANGGQGWEGYSGTHILEVGWDGFEEPLRELGFVRNWGTGSCRLYLRS